MQQLQRVWFDCIGKNNINSHSDDNTIYNGDDDNFIWKDASLLGVQLTWL